MKETNKIGYVTVDIIIDGLTTQNGFLPNQGTYTYTDGAGHTTQVVVTGYRIFLLVAARR